MLHINNKMTKISDIKIWYRFKPSIDIWFSKSKGKSSIFKLWDETWYGGDSFVLGYFAFIQFNFIALHIKFKWWKIRL